MSQEEMKKKYEEQQTAVGKAVLQNQIELVNRFNQIIHTGLKVGRIERMINERTGENKFYIAE